MAAKRSFGITVSMHDDTYDVCVKETEGGTLDEPESDEWDYTKAGNTKINGRIFPLKRAALACWITEGERLFASLPDPPQIEMPFEKASE